MNEATGERKEPRLKLSTGKKKLSTDKAIPTDLSEKVHVPASETHKPELNSSNRSSTTEPTYNSTPDLGIPVEKEPVTIPPLAAPLTPPPLPRTSGTVPPPIQQESAQANKQHPALASRPLLHEMEEEKESSGNFLGILVLIIFILILGGSGYGIWYVLGFEKNEPTAESLENEIVAENAITHNASQNPISEAQEAIKKVLPIEDNNVDINSTAFSKMFQADDAVGEDLEPMVEAYLSNVHLGAFRTGNEARVMLDNETYYIGDIVHQETGLVFTGADSGKLRFKDKYGAKYDKTF